MPALHVRRTRVGRGARPSHAVQPRARLPAHPALEQHAVDEALDLESQLMRNLGIAA
ncbi:MAG: hypothetical protein WKF31_04355 [Thermoleophilaceae bacterium]